MAQQHWEPTFQEEGSQKIMDWHLKNAEKQVASNLEFYTQQEHSLKVKAK